MKKHQREIYLVLAEEVNCGIAPFCKYSSCEGSGSICDGGECYHVCEHPLSVINEQEGDHGIPCEEPGVDCWGFRPDYSLQDIADIVGIILVKGWTRWGWNIPTKDNPQIEVYGIKNDN